MDLIIKTLKVGELETNCYLVSDSEGNALVVDPGDEAAKIVQELENLRLMPKYLLLTHGHYDHVMAVDDLKMKYPNADIVIGEKDEMMLRSLDEQGKEFGKRLSNIYTSVLPVFDGSTLPFGKAEIKVIMTPGHTRGGVSYFLGNNIFSGDTLFYHNYGRTDLTGGSTNEMQKSLKRLLQFPKEINVWPGHGQTTTIGEEQATFGYN